MKSLDFSNPTIVLITDRTDLDDQLTEQFINAKSFIQDQTPATAFKTGNRGFQENQQGQGCRLFQDVQSFGG